MQHASHHHWLISAHAPRHRDYRSAYVAGENLRDFYLAGGGLTALPLFFTLYATQYSGNTLFGFAGNAYREGPVIFFAALGMAMAIASYRCLLALCRIARISTTM